MTRALAQDFTEVGAPDQDQLYEYGFVSVYLEVIRGLEGGGNGVGGRQEGEVRNKMRLAG